MSDSVDGANPGWYSGFKGLVDDIGQFPNRIATGGVTDIQRPVASAMKPVCKARHGEPAPPEPMQKNDNIFLGVYIH